MDLLDLPASELTELCAHLVPLPRVTQKEVIRFLGPQLAAEQRRQLATLLQANGIQDAVLLTESAQYVAIRTSKSGRLLPFTGNAPKSDSKDRLVAAIGLVQPASNTPSGRPSAKKFGRVFLRKFGSNLRELVCGNSRTFRKERTRLKGMGRNTITIGVPIIMATLGLPAIYTGAAIVISTMISSLGIASMCHALDEVTPTSASGQKKKTKVKAAKKR
jgi:hypothetical protein